MKATKKKPNKANIQTVLRKCQEYGVYLPTQIQYILATVLHETAGTFNPIKEYGGRKYFESRYDPFKASTPELRERAVRMGNTKIGDGAKYCGRGYIQLTWKSNYQKMSDLLGMDFVSNPNLVLDSEISADILVIGMRDGLFTGKCLDDYIEYGKCDFLGARKIVNNKDKRNKIALLALSLNPENGEVIYAT